jgi:hypothetical protein
MQRRRRVINIERQEGEEGAAWQSGDGRERRMPVGRAAAAR